jgi:pyridoxal phosphate enzyme (YggS family)
VNDYSYIKSNLAAVRHRLAEAAERRGRPVPTLVAVTKSASPEEFSALVRCGVRDVAENRVQLFRERAALLSGIDDPPALHLIGSLQTNKVKYLIGGVALIQSLDSLRLAAEIDRLSRLREVVTEVLVEVNSGREAAKGGLLPEEVEAFVREASALPGIRIRGLMTMGPASPDPEDLRAPFRQTRELFDRLCAQDLFSTPLPILSMGMSESYTVAAEEGATMVRVGRALFARPAQ